MPSALLSLFLVAMACCLARPAVGLTAIAAPAAEVEAAPTKEGEAVFILNLTQNCSVLVVSTFFDRETACFFISFDKQFCLIKATPTPASENGHGGNHAPAPSVAHVYLFSCNASIYKSLNQK